MFGFACLLLTVGGVGLAYGFQWGRSSIRKEYAAYCLRHGCNVCGAVVKPTLIHVSGCEAGWADGPRCEQLDVFPSEVFGAHERQ